MFSVICLFRRELLQKHRGKPVTKEREDGAQNRGEDHIGGVVHIQVQPGEGNQHRQNQGGDAQLFVVQENHNRGFEGGDGMAGGEGKVMHPVDKQRDFPCEIRHLEIIGAYPANQRLQPDVADQKPQNQGNGHTKTGFAVFFGEEKYQGYGNPEDTGIPEQGDDGHQCVQNWTPEICCDPVQDRKVKADGQRVEHRANHVCHRREVLLLLHIFR